MDDPVHRSLPCYMQAQQLSKSLTMKSKPLWSCIWFCIHLWQYFLNFWPSCKQTASYCVWKFCSSTFTCLMTNIRNSWLCFKILWLNARYIVERKPEGRGIKVCAGASTILTKVSIYHDQKVTFFLQIWLFWIFDIRHVNVEEQTV